MSALSGSRQPVDVVFGPAGARGFAAIVTLCGEHDIATRDETRAALAPLAGHVLVDLSACEFIDSTVIGLLLHKSRQLRGDGFLLEVVVPAENTAVRRIIEVVGLRTHVHVHESTEDALGA